MTSNANIEEEYPVKLRIDMVIADILDRGHPWVLKIHMVHS